MYNIRETLAELVALKDLKEQFDTLKQDVPDVATAAVLEGMSAEYHRRQPLAWAAARAALAEQPSAKEVDWEEMAEDVLRQEREDHAARDAMSRQPSVREPLSDEQIAQLWSPHPGGLARRPILGWAKVCDFARNIERLHGIGVKGEA